MHVDINKYHAQLDNTKDKEICDKLHNIIQLKLSYTESKIWHAHPVWFINGNPIVGYHKLKNCIRLLFWSGQSFNESVLIPEGKFKAAEIRYTDVKHINEKELLRLLDKSITIQWDYKNLIKRKGMLEKLTEF